MQCKLINGLKLKLKLIFILFKVCFVFSLVQAEELKDFRPEMPAWLQERPSSSKSEDTNAFHPRRPYKWWNAKQMRDTQRVLFGIIYDEKVQRRSMEVSKERWKQSAQLQKTVRFIAAGTDEEICFASGFLGNDDSFNGMGRITLGNGPQKIPPCSTTMADSTQQNRILKSTECFPSRNLPLLAGTASTRRSA